MFAFATLDVAGIKRSQTNGSLSNNTTQCPNVLMNLASYSALGYTGEHNASLILLGLYSIISLLLDVANITIYTWNKVYFIIERYLDGGKQLVAQTICTRYALLAQML